MKPSLLLDLRRGFKLVSDTGENTLETLVDLGRDGVERIVVCDADQLLRVTALTTMSPSSFS